MGDNENENGEQKHNGKKISEYILITILGTV